MAATLSTNTIITLVDTRVNNGSINLPATSNIVNRTIYFKDLYGSFNTNYLQINTVGADTFEDGTSQKKFNDKYTNMLLHADTIRNKWLILGGTQQQSFTVSSIQGLSSITSEKYIGNGSNLYGLNAISSLSLISTVTGLGTFGYISSTQLISSLQGLGTLAYVSSLDNWSLYPATNSIVMNNNNITSLHSITGYASYPVEFASFIDMTTHDISNAGFVYVSGGIYTNAIATYNTSNITFNNPIDMNNTNSISNVLDVVSQDVHIVGTLYTDNIQSYTTGTVNFNNNEISNVNQTNRINSAATNVIIPQSLTNTIDGTYFDIGILFTQILTASPAIIAVYNNAANIFNTWEVTFTFDGTFFKDDTVYGYYFELSNLTQAFNTDGIHYNKSRHPYFDSNPFQPKITCQSYTDIYDLSLWQDQDQYIPLLYIKGTTKSSNYFTAGSYHLCMTPIVTYY